MRSGGRGPQANNVSWVVNACFSLVREVPHGLKHKCREYKPSSLPGRVINENKISSLLMLLGFCQDRQSRSMSWNKLRWIPPWERNCSCVLIVASGYDHGSYVWLENLLTRWVQKWLSPWRCPYYLSLGSSVVFATTWTETVLTWSCGRRWSERMALRASWIPALIQQNSELLVWSPCSRSYVGVSFGVLFSFQSPCGFLGRTEHQSH